MVWLRACKSASIPSARGEQGPRWPVRIMPGDVHALDPASSSRKSVLVMKWHDRGQMTARQLIQISSLGGEDKCATLHTPLLCHNQL